MSHKSWKHYCKVTKRDQYLLREICPDCNEPGIYDGYRLSVVEHMCSYNVRTKLPPYGLHRPFADTLFKPYFKKCPKCHGQGIIDAAGVKGAKNDYGRVCPVCQMGQYIFDGTSEEFEAIRKQVNTAYPCDKVEIKDKSVRSTEPASELLPPPSEPHPLSSTSPAASPQAFFTRLTENSKEGIESMATGIASSLEKFIENEKNFQISDHRSKYTYTLRHWTKHGGTFYPKIDGIELCAISKPSATLAVLFIESPFIASIILDWNLDGLGMKEKDVLKFRKSIPRPDKFTVIRDLAYLPINDSFTQPLFDQLLDALVDLDNAISSVQ